METTGPMIFFDGVCNLCNSSVRFIYKRDKKNRFSYRSLQSKEAQDILATHQVDSADLKSIVYIENGQLFTKSTAVLKIARHLRWPYNWLSAYLIVPKFIRDGVYGYIAKNRYRWFGKQDEVCEFDPDFNAR